MRPAIPWVKAIGATVAAAGAVGIAANHLVDPESARVWLMVWMGGAVPWLIGSLIVPEPGYRLIAGFPFFERRTDSEAAPGSGRWVRIAIVVTRAAFVVHAAALAVYLVKEVRDVV